MASLSASSTVAARISAFQNRPTTSFEPNKTPRRTFLQKQHSQGNLIGSLDGANELVEARARLKHIGRSQKSPKKEEDNKQDQEPQAAIGRRLTNSSVLEELDDLLDTAIGEHATQFTSADDTPDWPLLRTKSITSKPSKFALRHSASAAKRRQIRQKQVQADHSDTIESNTADHSHWPSIDSERPRSSTDSDVGQYPLPSQAEREPVKIEVPRQIQESKSPIKQRAALFEKLAQHEAVIVHEIPHIHDARNPTKIRGIWPPKQDAGAKEKARGEFVTSLEKHHKEFHHGKDKAVVQNNVDSLPRTSSPEKPRKTHVPPIPLALPQLLSPRRRSRPDVRALRDSFAAAPQMIQKAPNVPTKESSIVAVAEPDHHTSAKKSHENQHRVHDLLLTATKKAARAPSPDIEPAAEKEVTTQLNTTPGTPGADIGFRIVKHSPHNLQMVLTNSSKDLRSVAVEAVFVSSLILVPKEVGSTPWS